MTIRTRFAPSPTGYMHLGNLRTALYAWLYAKHNNGKFILRIEDTDLERSTPEAIRVILDSLQWLDIDYDEGPYYQTKRFDRYKEVIQKLLDEGKAYKCYCSKERLEQLRTDQLARKEKPRYDRVCRLLTELQPNSPYVIRFKNPEDGVVRFEDQVRGVVEFQNSELDDLIIARTDGTPTYNFCVVVDDMDMDVTHVIRGADHINNTPRQINIFNALGAKPPIYAHVPLILGSDGKLLSKRHGALSVLDYRDEGILPHALLNYLVRLGWSHGDQEIFSRAEMIEFFDMTHLNKSAAAFDAEKLLWLNQHYLKADAAEDIAKDLSWNMEHLGIDVSNGPALVEIVKAQAERCKTLKEMAEKSRYFYEDFADYDEKAAKKNFEADTAAVLTDVLTLLEQLSSWSAAALHEVILQVAEKRGLKLGKVAQPIRVAVTGGTISPPIDITLMLVGRERCLQRLSRAIEHMQKNVL